MRGSSAGRRATSLLKLPCARNKTSLIVSTALLVFWQAGCAHTAGGSRSTPPAAPAAIGPPEGAKVAARFHAVGAQVYVCGAATPLPGAQPTYAWTLKLPDATLYDASGAAVGTHGAGPSWTSKDGSSATGEKAAQADAPDADGIPWLLVRTTATSGQGVFSKVTYVQRVNTKGGKPPATGCDAGAVGRENRADYSADYYFYELGAPAP